MLIKCLYIMLYSIAIGGRGMYSFHGWFAKIICWLNILSLSLVHTTKKVTLGEPGFNLGKIL